MRKPLFLLTMTLVAGVLMLSQSMVHPQTPPSPTWWRVYHAYDNNGQELGQKMLLHIGPTADNGYVAIGNTFQETRMLTGAQWHVTVLRLDDAGEVQSQTAYDYGPPEHARCVARAPDGGYIIGGQAGNAGNYNLPFFDAFAMKLDQNGQPVWHRTFHLADGMEHTVYSIQPTGDGGYIASGGMNSSFLGAGMPFLLKLDAEGNVQTTGIDPVPLSWVADSGLRIFQVRQIIGGGYILVGTVEGSDPYNHALWVAKLQSNFDIVFSNTYGPIGYAYSPALPGPVVAVHETTGGNLVIAMNYNQGLGVAESDAIRVVTLSPVGAVVSVRAYTENTDSIYHYTAAGSMEPTSDGGFVFSGEAQCKNTLLCPDMHFFLFKVDASGTVEHARSYGEEGWDSGLFATPTSMGYAAVGSGDTHWKAWVLQLDSSLDIPTCPNSLPASMSTTNIPVESLTVEPYTLLLTPAPPTIGTTTPTPLDPGLVDSLQCFGSLDIDRDGVLNSGDNCPQTYNPDQADSDGDGVGDVCDNCPDTPNAGQEDTDGDGIGNACETIDERVDVSSMVVQPGEPIVLTATFVNDSGAPITTIRPDCYNTTFTLTSSGDQTLYPACRFRKAYGIGLPQPSEPPDPLSDVIVIPPKDPAVPGSGEFSVTCNLTEPGAEMFQASQLAGDTYTVRATYANFVQDPDLTSAGCASPPCVSLWRGAVTSSGTTLTVLGQGNTVSADVAFDPSVWNTDWAAMSGQRVRATITGINPEAVDRDSIRLNGSVPIRFPYEWWITPSEPNALIVEFDGPAALMSLGTALPGTYYPTVYGKLAGTNTYFWGKSAVTLQDLEPVLVVKVDRHIVGSGTYPTPAKEALAGVPVRLYSKAPGSCAARIGISWQNYAGIWETCGYDFGAEAESNTNGQAIFSFVPPGDYLAIGKAVVPRPENPGTSETLYIGVSVGPLPADALVSKYLQVIQNFKNQNVPGKYRQLKGSDLLIIEPEYVEWSEQSEPYPFVFDSVGDWTITTSVTPPEGFVADHDALSTEVISELKALQFIITDIGSEWVPTKVKHKIKHKGKTQTIKSEIGVKRTLRHVSRGKE